MRLWLALILCLALTPAARAECRLALVLALDVSASVDVNEYKLQMNGMAAALTSPRVREALAEAGPVSVAAFVWSGPQDQALVADWTTVDGEGALDALAATIAAHPRKIVFDGRTAIGSALQYASALLARGPVCGRQVIDLAADGETNAGPEPADLRDGAVLLDTTVNALAVTGAELIDHGDDPAAERPLTAYLRQSVIWGPGAFVELAADYRDFEAAMTRKLLRELDVMVVTEAVPQATTPMRSRKQP